LVEPPSSFRNVNKPEDKPLKALRKEIKSIATFRRKSMFREKKVNRKLAEGFRQSLASVLGESGYEVVMKFGRIPEDRLDPVRIDSSLNVVFGPVPEGLSSIHKNVLEGMSSRLGVALPRDELGDSNDFYSSMVYLAARYRLKERTGFGFAGVVAGMISSLCCLGPIAFALLGFASLSASLSLAMTLTSIYEPVELAASLVFLGTVIYYQLRRKNQCSLNGLRRNLSYVIIPAVTLLVSYAIISYSIGVVFYGHPLNPLP
jgi:hypothetical protein